MSEGMVTLSGSVPEAEAARLLSRVARIRGVAGVDDRLNRIRASDGKAGAAPVWGLLGAVGLVLLAFASRADYA